MRALAVITIRLAVAGAAIAVAVIMAGGSSLGPPVGAIPNCCTLNDPNTPTNSATPHEHSVVPSHGFADGTVTGADTNANGTFNEAGERATAAGAPDANTHQHVDGHPFQEGNTTGDPDGLTEGGPFSSPETGTKRISYSAIVNASTTNPKATDQYHWSWDNRRLRFYQDKNTAAAKNIRHGYIDELGYGLNGGDEARLRYAYCDDVPQGARPAIDKAFVEWDLVEHPDRQLITGIGFTKETGGACPVTTDPAADAAAKRALGVDVLVEWRDRNLGGDVARTIEFDIDGARPYLVVRFKSAENFWSYEIAPKDVPPNRRHLLSTALHEIGHVLGLEHLSVYRADGSIRDDNMIWQREPGCPDVTTPNSFSGTTGPVAANTGTTLKDSGAPAWANNQWLDGTRGGWVRITGGTGAGQAPRKVVSNNADTITVTPAWAPIPDGSTYTVYALRRGPCFSSVTGDAKHGAIDLYSIPTPDFGDAPFTYPTRLSDNGARAPTLAYEWLGPAAADSPTTREPRRRPFDERDDGCSIDVTPEGVATVEYTISVRPGARTRYLVPFSFLYVAIWVDWNRDGDWTEPTVDAGELLDLDPGSPRFVHTDDPAAWPADVNFMTYTREFTVPAQAEPGETWMRCRLAYGLSPNAHPYLEWNNGDEGLVPLAGSPDNGGEIEDHEINCSLAGPPLSGLACVEEATGVGGTVELLAGGDDSPTTAADGGSDIPYATIAGGAAVAFVVFAGGGWYVRRRRVRR